jgi:outer membrane protein assembly factor BamB
MYYPLQNMCMTVEVLADPTSSLYGISMPARIAPNTDKVGTVHAISAESGRTTWKYEQRAGMMSLMVTAGGLVFGGDIAGRFRAFDDRTGKVLWETNLGSPVSGYPVTFASGGKQYVAVSTGPSLVAGGAGRLTPEIRPSNSNQVFVFELP